MTEYNCPECGAKTSIRKSDETETCNECSWEGEPWAEDSRGGYTFTGVL